ncbi:transcriptional regulator TbsP domain-containing protein [Halalkaliarchaeum desulfuricum]|uniref:transcriptional regulator TbsP domain-containing protein n=1 Tax=Halalkaliarchaeum desulfuricum TaxID=2055893 RepID=UPI00105AB0FC|nr:DUF5821 family protein [Halalkaliarchaeum desulfuricum]
MLESLCTIEDSTASPAIVLVNPPVATLAALADVVTDRDPVTLPSMGVVAEEATLKFIRKRFPIAAKLAELVDTDRLDLRVGSDDKATRVCVTSDTVVTLVPGDSELLTLESQDTDAVEAAREMATNQFETGESFSLRTPPLSTVRSGLEDRFGAAVREDFDRVLAAVADNEAGNVDAVTLLLLVGCKHELQQYKLSTWGEDVSLASKATFSRAKTELEDQGLLDTERVPPDIGRPRNRLVLPDNAKSVAQPPLDRVCPVLEDKKMVTASEAR